jgi:hypothetical protein
MKTEPELCPVCGSSDVVAGDCQTCTEIDDEIALEEQCLGPDEICSTCGSSDIIDGECQPCADVAAEVAAEDVPQDEP